METPRLSTLRLSRRAALSTAASSLLLPGWSRAAAGAASRPKRLIYLFLSGGASQLETWDPKPGVATGGPFGAIPTTADGVRISELLPRMARQMHRVALVRGLNSDGYGDGHDGAGILCGRVPQSGLRYPTLCELAARAHREQGASVPFVELQSTDAYRFESQSPPASPLGLSVLVTHGSPSAEVDDSWFWVASRLRVPERDGERYGNSDLGRFCAQARRLVEAGVPVVKIRHPWWDTHAEHFERHADLVSQLDQAFSSLLQDLHDRGLLSETLVVVASEFGRSPEVNRYGGRDHWTRAWSVALAGGGVPGGTVWGRTSADGREVIENEVTPAGLHDGCLRLLGLETTPATLMAATRPAGGKGLWA